jgi:UDPglucose 6-dehydrogenase
MKNIRIAVVGMGYVGLTTSVVFAMHGFNTICTDIIKSRVDDLNGGILPFYEPDLSEIADKVVKDGFLYGSIDNSFAVQNSDVIFICVGTPSLDDGSADLSAIEAVAAGIGKILKNVDDYRLVVIKSTVPPGTTENTILPIIEKNSEKKVGIGFGLCMNPEFLRQGQAMYDSLNPDRIVIGQYDKSSGDILEDIYSDFTCPKLRCDIRAAEMIKYASNSLLATKITFANEFARMCEKLNIDVYEVMKGVGLDSRINPRFLNAGCGFGGSCFPKDVNAMIALSKKINVETPLLDSVIYTNDLQPKHFVNLIKNVVGSLDGKKITFLGLSFKPNTDDVRDTRALPIIELLYSEGASVKAFDPKAIENFKKLTDLPIIYCDNLKEALINSDFVIIQSEWKDFQDINAEEFKKMKNPIIFDSRRTYDPKKLISNGIDYFGIGWKNIKN